MDTSKLLAPAFALLLVVSAMGGGFAVQPAAATHECGDLEQIATFALGTVGYAGDQVLKDGKCSDSHRAQAIEEMVESDANQTELDIYNAALQQQAETESTSAVYDNYLNDTEPAAWMQAEITIAESYEDGDTKSVARSNSRVAIQDYYATKQVNHLNKWSVAAESAWSLKRIAQNESGISGGYVDFTGSTSSGSMTLVGVEQVNVTLVNGSTHETSALRLKYDAYDTTYRNVYPGNTGGFTKVWGSSDYDFHPDGIRVNAPTDDHDAVTYMSFDEWDERRDRIENQNSNLQDESDTFVNETWDAYDSGGLNASDIVSRNTQMFRYGETTVNGSGNLYTTVAALSSMGLDTPELNGTGTMEVIYSGTTYHGIVMAREAPNGSWEANTTYNSSTIDGPVFMATTAGEKVELDGEFTVGTISSEDGGENIQNVTATKVVYKTSNVSEQLDKMERIAELRAEVEAREPDGGGDGSDGGTDIDPKYLLGGIAIMALLALGANRED